MTPCTGNPYTQTRKYNQMTPAADETCNIPQGIINLMITQRTPSSDRAALTLTAPHNNTIIQLLTVGYPPVDPQPTHICKHDYDNPVSIALLDILTNGSS